jgi:hypothetical protein
MLQRKQGGEWIVYGDQDCHVMRDKALRRFVAKCPSSGGAHVLRNAIKGKLAALQRVCYTATKQQEYRRQLLTTGTKETLSDKLSLDIPLKYLRQPHYSRRCTKEIT